MATRDTEAARLHRELVAAFTAAGWPVEAEDCADGGRWLSYPGPVTVSIVDPDLPDTRGEELRVSLTAPLTFEDPPWVQLDATSTARDHGPAAVVGAAAAELGRVRGEATAAVVNDTACGICGDLYPRGHLIAPDPATDPGVCPACVFDGDLAPADVAGLVAQLDHGADSDLAWPAGWIAPTVLLAHLAAPGLPDRLADAHPSHRAWMTAEVWTQPQQAWLWLPPAATRPGWLSGFGPGAGLGDLTDTVNRQRPALITRFRTQLAALEPRRALAGALGGGTGLLDARGLAGAALLTPPVHPGLTQG